MPLTLRRLTGPAVAQPGFVLGLDTPHTGVHRLARRFVEPAQDVLVLGIAVALFALRVRTLVRLFRELFAPVLDFRVVIGEVLFTLVMVEVVRLLIFYLR